MGVLDVCGAAMRGTFDWVEVYGLIDHLREVVADAVMPVEVHPGDGLFVEGHLCDPKLALTEQLDRAQALVDEANGICVRVMEAL